MKRIAETLGVARSNLVERAAGKHPKRGPQTRTGDAELTSDIRRLVDGRPSYGYRRIAALLKRERRSAGPGSCQRQASLPVDEEERLVTGPAYRAPRRPSP